MNESDSKIQHVENYDIDLKKSYGNCSLFEKQHFDTNICPGFEDTNGNIVVTGQTAVLEDGSEISTSDDVIKYIMENRLLMIIMKKIVIKDIICIPMKHV